jgi:hypothetical protein
MTELERMLSESLAALSKEQEQQREALLTVYKQNQALEQQVSGLSEQVLSLAALLRNTKKT